MADFVTVEVETVGGTYIVSTHGDGWHYEPETYEGEDDYSGEYPDMSSAISAAHTDAKNPVSHKEVP